MGNVNQDNNEKDINEIKVAELRTELERRKLKTTRNKAELQCRLRTARALDAEKAEERDKEVCEDPDEESDEDASEDSDVDVDAIGSTPVRRSSCAGIRYLPTIFFTFIRIFLNTHIHIS